MVMSWRLTVLNVSLHLCQNTRKKKILENKDEISLHGLHALWLLKKQQNFLIKYLEEQMYPLKLF